MRSQSQYSGSLFWPGSAWHDSLLTRWLSCVSHYTNQQLSEFNACQTSLSFICVEVACSFLGRNNCYTMLFPVWYFAYIIDRLSVSCLSRTWVNHSLSSWQVQDFPLWLMSFSQMQTFWVLVFWCGLPCNFLDRYLSAKLHRVISQKTGLLIWVSDCHHSLGLYLEAESSQIVIVTTHSLQSMELTIHFYQKLTLRMCGVWLAGYAPAQCGTWISKSLMHKINGSSP